MIDSTVSEVCDKLLDLLVDDRRISMVAAVAETGEDPRLVREAFEVLRADGRARLVGGTHRGWSLARREPIGSVRRL